MMIHNTSMVPTYAADNRTVLIATTKKIASNSNITESG